MIAVTPTDDQLRRFKLGQFILDGSQGKETAAGKFSRVEFIVALVKEQPQHLGPDNRKQPMQQSLFDAVRIISNALSSQVHRSGELR